MRAYAKDALLCLLFFLAVAGLFIHGAVNSGYPWQWERSAPLFISFSGKAWGEWTLGPLLRTGLACTIRISFFALLLALALGLLTVFLRLAGGIFAKSCAIAFVQSIRNTPLMVQMLALYMLVPASWNIPASSIAIISLACFEGAYLAEIFRAGICAVPAGQWDAAESLGLPASCVWRKIILPQAVRHSLPPTLSQCVSLIKDSSLAGIIAVNELTQQANLLISDTFLSLEIWLPVAGIYLLLALLLSGLAQWLEFRLGKGFSKAKPVRGI